MPSGQASDEAVGGADVVVHVATGLLRKAMGAMSVAVDRLIARLKTDAQFRKFIFTEPFNMGADVDPRMVNMFVQTIHGLCLSANDGERQEIARLLDEMKPTDEEVAKGWQGGIDAAKALVMSRIPPVQESPAAAEPAHPPRAVALE